MRPEHTAAPDSTHSALHTTFVVVVVVVDRYVLKGFSKEGRDLTDDETKAFLKAADKDGDGKIGIDGERGALCPLRGELTQAPRSL